MKVGITEQNPTVDLTGSSLELTSGTKLGANTFGAVGTGLSFPETVKDDQYIPPVRAQGEIDDDPR